MEAQEPGRGSMRRAADKQAQWRWLATVFGMCLTLAGMIWSAARMSASVEANNSATAELKTVTQSLRETMTTILVQVARNSAEIEALKARLDDRDGRKR